MKLFHDRAHIVYVNGAYRGTDEVGALMQDFRCDDYRDIRNPKIRARVKYFKEETEGVAAMCKTMQVIVDREREDAEVAKGKRIALNLWKNGEHDLDKIAQTTELSLEQVGLGQLPRRLGGRPGGYAHLAGRGRRPYVSGQRVRGL